MNTMLCYHSAKLHLRWPNINPMVDCCREIWMKMITAKAKHYFKELFFIRTAIYLTLYYYNFVPSFIYNLYFYFQFGNAILHPTVNIMPLFIDLLTPWIESWLVSKASEKKYTISMISYLLEKVHLTRSKVRAVSRASD